MRKIKVAFIYHENNPYLLGTHYDNVYYNFFMKALRENDEN